MARARPPHSPIDRAISGLYEAASSPHRIPLVKVELNAIFHQVLNPAHRLFLETKLSEIEVAQHSPHALARIRNEIDAWNTREFPVHGGYER